MCACWKTTNSGAAIACSTHIHYPGSLKPVGERLYSVVTDAQGEWLKRPKK